MSDFNLDTLKKTWQEQEVQPKYARSEISQMLHKKSRNYVKYIFWISLVEFFIFFCLGIFYIFRTENDNSLFDLLRKLGIQESPQLQQNFEHLFFSLKFISLLITAFFVVQFYLNYKKIKVQDNLKLFILQIVKFRKTVNAFILTNIAILLIFTVILTAYIFQIFSEQNISLTHPKLIGFIVVLVLTTTLAVLLIWLYYKLVYGIIISKLGRNLKELQKIEED